jgi:hypothetical protein
MAFIPAENLVAWLNPNRNSEYLPLRTDYESLAPLMDYFSSKVQLAEAAR